MSHRGYKKKYPENTLRSIESAKEIGFEWVELDLVSTKDRVVVCSHNFDLESETDGVGYIYDLLYDDIKYLSAGVKSHPLEVQRIPSIEEVFKNYSNKLKYNLEIKTKSLFDLVTVKSLIKTIEKNNLEFIMISSFNPIVIIYLKLFHTKIKTAFLVEGMKYLWLINWIHPNYLNIRADMLSNKLIKQSKKHKYGLIVWTVNTDMGIDFCLKKNVLSIITDRNLNIKL